MEQRYDGPKGSNIRENVGLGDIPEHIVTEMKELTRLWAEASEFGIGPLDDIRCTRLSYPDGGFRGIF